MSYLSRIEAKLNEVDADVIVPLKPIKFNEREKKDPAKKAKAPKAGAAKGAKEKVGFSDLSNTRRLVPLIQDELQNTDPFDFKNETWVWFIKKVAPQLLAALLLDMKIVPKAKRAEFVRYITKRLRSLVK